MSYVGYLCNSSGYRSVARYSLNINSTLKAKEGSFMTSNLLPHWSKVDPSGRYNNLVTIQSFGIQYRLTGGINLPKIITCVGSDGISRTQLVKVGGALHSFPSLCGFPTSVLFHSSWTFTNG